VQIGVRVPDSLQQQAVGCVAGQNGGPGVTAGEPRLLMVQLQATFAFAGLLRVAGPAATRQQRADTAFEMVERVIGGLQWGAGDEVSEECQAQQSSDH
jgi:hypothetical protein